MADFVALITEDDDSKRSTKATIPVIGYAQAGKNGFFDDAGNIGDASKKHMQRWVDAYVAWVKLHAGA